MWCSAIGCIVTLILSLLAVPLAAEAPSAGEIPRLGVLVLGLPDRGLEPFHQGLQDLGYVEGKTIAITYQQFPLIAIEPLSHMSLTCLFGNGAGILPNSAQKKRPDGRIQARAFRALGRRGRGRGEIAGCGQRDVRGTGRDQEVSVLKSGRCLS